MTSFRMFGFVLVPLTPFVVWASQTYFPPPPPNLPAKLSDEMVRTGKALFEENKLVEGKIEIHNYLGKKSCASCHDKPTRLNPKSLAKRFRLIRQRINLEIEKRSGGTPLPPQGPQMEALVQYLVHRYRLYEYKLSK